MIGSKCHNLITNHNAVYTMKRVVLHLGARLDPSDIFVFVVVHTWRFGRRQIILVGDGGTGKTTSALFAP
jgi:flagellar biosynthesis GTPase FlhF